MQFELNGNRVQVDADPSTPLLWVLRDHLNVTSPKYGCGIAMCGACTVHINGQAVRACSLPVGQAADAKITTLEGLAPGPALHPVQEAWIEQQVAQCGYCQPGQIMTASALLARNARPSDEDIDRAMSGNACRCGTYPRIRQAIKLAALRLPAKPGATTEAQPTGQQAAAPTPQPGQPTAKKGE